MSKSKAPTPVISKPSSSVAQITIDGVSYNVDELTEAAKQQLGNVRLVDQELARLQRQRAIAGVARTAYVNAASAQLPREVTPAKDGGRSIVIDGVAHDWDSLGEKVHALLAGIRAADQELARLQAQISLAQTARGTFSNIVKQNLPKRDAA